MLNEAEYEEVARTTIQGIEEAIEARAPDIEFETEDEILTLEFPDGSRIIINKQRPLKQIWVAARSGGFHYDYDTEQRLWLRAGGHELLADVESFAAQQLKAPVRLR